MYNCPHCGASSISKMDKFFLGPASKMQCKKCGKEIGVAKSSYIFVVILVLMALFVVKWFDSSVVQIAFISCLTVLAVVIQLQVVPLEKR
ncbi:MAG: hypothetical protein N2171_06070 [Clostridia bacterium]|nr:hypothetical protein [Clostridia bacterium]